MTEHEGALLLFERLRNAERASLGIDPDGTAYLDAADKIALARAAYRAVLDADATFAADARGDDQPYLVTAFAELL